MKVIVDTSVWSLALRRKQALQNRNVMLFQDLIIDGRVVLLGVVRQEVLSGIRHTEQFEKLRQHLQAFPNLELTIEDYELAARFYNLCRSKGVQGANTDFLICAAAKQRNYTILTTDKDFEIFNQHINIELAKPLNN